MTERPPDRPAQPGDPVEAIAGAKAEARAAGLVAEFRAVRRGQTLGGLKPKDLVVEGRDPEPTDGA